MERNTYKNKLISTLQYIYEYIIKNTSFKILNIHSLYTTELRYKYTIMQCKSFSIVYISLKLGLRIYTQNTSGL